MLTKIKEHEVERVVNSMKKNDILSMYRAGKSQREIARTVGVSRNTVAKYVNESKEIMEIIESETDQSRILQLQENLTGPPRRKRVSPKRKFSGDVEHRFYEIIRISEEKDQLLGPNKQKLTGTFIYRTLKHEGYDIGKTTIINEFRKYNDKNKKSFIKQSYDPGYRAEYDFHEVKVLIDDKKKKLYQATISMPYSNYKFVKYYPNQKMESFIDSLVSFFTEIGGVPQTMVFDNMKNVVRKFVYKGEKEYTDNLLKLSNYYGFKIVTTNAYSGNEKGHVENSGKIVRKELFTLNYQFDTINDLRLYSRSKVSELNTAIKDKLNFEQAHLMKLPLKRYELGRPQKSIVNHESLISIDANFYSVPDSYVGKTVYTNIYLDYLEIYNEKYEHLASHKKRAGKGQYSIDIKHFLPTLLKKPGALLNSLALKQAPKIYQRLLHKYFITNPKDFLKLIKEKDIYELKELLKSLDGGYKITSLKCETTTIEEISLKQINQIENMFNLGEQKQ